MRESDYAEFSGLLDGVCSLLSRGQYVPSATNTALWFRVLSEHDLAAVRLAFDAHVRDPQRGRFVPVPADILAQIEAAAELDGRPGPEEAWSIAVRGSDERVTVVWTDEISEAWGVARPVLELGDEVGARMAFREAYQRILAASRKERTAPRWWASLGHDQQARAVAIGEAVQLGRLPAEEMLALPHYQATFTAPPAIREKLLALRAELAAEQFYASPDAQAKADTASAKEELTARLGADPRFAAWAAGTPK